MPTLTLSDLIDRTRKRSNMERSGFVSDDEITEYLNESGSELHDILIETYGDEYFSTTYSFAKSVTTVHALPSDFYKLIVLSASYSNRSYPIKKVNMLASARGVLNTIVESFDLVYVPEYTPLALGTDVITVQDAWAEYIILGAAIKCLIKEESDPQALMLSFDKSEERIRRVAKSRDQGQPSAVIDVRSLTSRFSSMGYIIRGSNLIITSNSLMGDIYE